MSAGVKGILAVGTDLFHIFAKAIMGSVLHRKLGNVNVKVALVFLVGSILGATAGGILNRFLYEKDPMGSELFITLIYALLLGFLTFYSQLDFFKARKAAKGKIDTSHGKTEGVELGALPKKVQGFRLPPMIHFDQDITPGGRSVSWLVLVIAGVLVGVAASIMGVGGGFITFPMFVYCLGVSSATTVGTDIFQIIFTAGYSSIGQYAIYGFVFYTLAMGMLLGSLVGIQIGTLVTKVVPGLTIRGFYALAVSAGFINRLFALPGKLASMGYLPISKGVGSNIESVGNVAFFVVLAAFAFWVFKAFFTNLSAFRADDSHHVASQEV